MSSNPYLSEFQETAPTRGVSLVSVLLGVAGVGLLVVMVALAVPAFMLKLGGHGPPRIGSEIAQLQNCMEDYSYRMGDHPPDFTDPDIVKLHLDHCYPNHQETPATITELCSQLDQGEALVFILQGLKNDPIFPLTGDAGPIASFNFTKSRLIDVDSDGFPSYHTHSGNPSPYLYFDIRGNDKTYNGEAGDQPVFTAYNVGTDYKPYQIVSAGLDGKFGAGGLVNSDDPAGQDNVANFTEGKLLKDYRPAD